MSRLTATIDDVARVAGVHRSTVSRALNPRTQVKLSPETTRRVQRAARELGYVPNAVARGLRTNESMSVGVVIPDILNPIFPPIISGIDSILRPAGYTALVTDIQGGQDAYEAALASLRQRRVDGLILATAQLDEGESFHRLHEQGIRAVLVNRAAASSPFPVVHGDDTGGMRAALDHLAALGHVRIAHLHGPEWLSTTAGRRAAFEEWCRQHPEVTVTASYCGPLTPEGGQEIMDALLDASTEARSRPTAVVTGNDLMALGALRSLRARGLLCPGDMSIVGFNDMPFADEFSPPLTTVQVPLRQLGIESARQLLRQLHGEGRGAMELTFPVTLMIRGSTAPPRG
ncbi:LacI family transcriptional regulator [Arthrobacter sp. V4I6]|uniref:LacI family DNA-binding transcriptional regulator n=1 Tax=unclassified Arthrobacter TaxID=235627 RepID=UPI002781FC93|nr:MULTISPECIES: LacI family DNA-binding transcriptional regulator [unclassified Arthrobacter]MDQ0821614.1 LacI family transcriptional regulator [Arthrobacter sp. V1I7]MDQ0855879.1 LacI family transcriptional regulator [Arthrobacter sp. V4I6]